MQTRPDPNPAHFYMAGIYQTTDGQPLGCPSSVSAASTRAQVFAWYDYIKRELPDVFFVNNSIPASYPTTPRISRQSDTHGTLIRPRARAISSCPSQRGRGVSCHQLDAGTSLPVGTGIFGASYFAAGGIYKNLGYLPTGYDGIDNNGNGLVDEWSEGVNSGNPGDGLEQPYAHKHNTARSEMLYAILVEGVGPLGSAFNRDDFTDREVQDTDGDGLPEFVDAWGQPLQFFRWPLLYHTDTQRGQVIDYWDYTQAPPAPSAVELFNPPYRTCVRDPRARPAGLQPAAHGAGLVVVDLEPQLAIRIPQRDGRIGRRQRRGDGLRVLLPPAYRALPAHWQHVIVLGSWVDLPLPQGLLLQTADLVSGPRRTTGNLPLIPKLSVPEPAPIEFGQPDLFREQRHTV